MVPNGWTSTNLGKIMEFKNGLNFKKSDSGELIKIVGVGDFKDFSELNEMGHLQTVNVSNIIKNDELLKDGDLLFVRSNGNKDLIGRCLFFPQVNERLSFSGFTIRGRVNIKKALPDYIASLARSSFMKQQISKSGGGTNISNLSQQILNDIVLLLPALPEQKKIIQILSTWDKAISNTEKLLANSELQKKALMQQLLTGKKRFYGFNADWDEYSLQKLGTTYNGLSGKSKNDFKRGKSYIPYVNIFNNSKIKVTKLELVNVESGERQNQVKYGDIFFTTSSETPHEVGMSSVLLDTLNETYLNSFCFGFRLYDFKRLLPSFAQFFLRSAKIRKEISALAQGATRYNLSPTRLMKIKFKLPSVKEQQKIALVLSGSDKEIEILQQKLDCLKQEKKALMQQLLTGKLRVKP